MITSNAHELQGVCLRHHGGIGVARGSSHVKYLKLLRCQPLERFATVCDSILGLVCLNTYEPPHSGNTSNITYSHEARALFGKQWEISGYTIVSQLKLMGVLRIYRTIQADFRFVKRTLGIPKP